MDSVIRLVKAHPFWTLLIAFAVLALVQFLFAFAGSGSGGLDTGPITTEPSGP